MSGPSRPTAPDKTAGPDTVKHVLSEAWVQRKPVVNGIFLNTCIKLNPPATENVSPAVPLMNLH